MAFGGMGMRTIWIGIRGMNYTDRATREVGSNIDELIRKQQQLKMSAIALIAGGIMWTVMATMATVAIGRLMDATVQGHRIMFAFGKATENVMKSLGENFVKILGPTIQMLTVFLNTVSRIQPLMYFLAV